MKKSSPLSDLAAYRLVLGAIGNMPHTEPPESCRRCKALRILAEKLREMHDDE